MSDLKPISDSVREIAKASFTRKFVTLSRILQYWNDIMGTELSTKSQPSRLSYRKKTDAQEKPKATLYISCNSAEWTKLSYQKNLILERINLIFGETWITDLKHDPAQSEILTRKKASAFVIPKAINQDELQSLQQQLSDISDEDLRNRLEKLGQSVLRQSPQN
jgi:hypothetical protein